MQGFALLENVGDAALRNLLSEANWFGLPGGTLLERDGENDAALFLVVTGCLGVFVADAQGQRRMVALAPAGETVGEMSLIARSQRTYAPSWWRCATPSLLRIRPEGFEALIARHPRVMMNLMQILVKRLTRHHPRRRPRLTAQDLRHRAAAGGSGSRAHRPPPGQRADRHGMPRRGAGCQRQRAERGMVQQFRSGA